MRDNSTIMKILHTRNQYQRNCHAVKNNPWVMGVHICSEVSNPCWRGVVKPFFKLLNQIKTKKSIWAKSLIWDALPSKLEKKDQPGSRNAIIKYFKINVTTQNSMCNHFPSLWEKNDASFEKYWLSRKEKIYMDIDICTMICQCIFTIPLPSPRVNLFNPPVNLRHHNHIYTDISPW